MPKQLHRIMAINPGTRYVGIAVFQTHELKDWGVKVFKGRWSKEKESRILKRVEESIDRWQPSILAVKQLNPSRSSEALRRLVEKIEALATKHELETCEYSLNEVHNLLSAEGKKNKRKLAEIVASKYPELSHDLEKEKAHKNLYHTRVFEAVALGIVCLSCHERRTNPRERDLADAENEYENTSN